MLETVRVYASERLVAAPDRDETLQRHTAWMLSLTERLLRAHGGEYRSARERLDLERANLRVTLRRLLDDEDVASVALLVRNAATYLRYRDAEVEAAGWLDRALASSLGAAPRFAAAFSSSGRSWQEP